MLSIQCLTRGYREVGLCVAEDVSSRDGGGKMGDGAGCGSYMDVSGGANGSMTVG